MVVGFIPNGSTGEIAFDVIALTSDGSHIGTVRTPDIDPLMTGALINTAIKAAVREHAETAWEVEFGLLDVVLLLAGVNPV